MQSPQLWLFFAVVAVFLGWALKRAVGFVSARYRELHQGIAQLQRQVMEVNDRASRLEVAVISLTELQTDSARLIGQVRESLRLDQAAAEVEQALGAGKLSEATASSLRQSLAALREETLAAPEPF